MLDREEALPSRLHEHALDVPTLTYVYTVAPVRRLPSISDADIRLDGTVMVPSMKPQVTQDCLRHKISARSGHLGLAGSWLGSLMVCPHWLFQGRMQRRRPDDGLVSFDKPSLSLLSLDFTSSSFPSRHAEASTWGGFFFPSFFLFIFA
jgi:hypothetical protein